MPIVCLRSLRIERVWHQRLWLPDDRRNLPAWCWEGTRAQVAATETRLPAFETQRCQWLDLTSRLSKRIVVLLEFQIRAPASTPHRRWRQTPATSFQPPEGIPSGWLQPMSQLWRQLPNRP